MSCARNAARRKDTSTAIFFLDQLYPLPRPEITAALEAHPNAREIIWVQEEPSNMGAHFYVLPRLQRLAQDKGLKRALRETLGQREPGDRFRQGARAGAEDVAELGVYDDCGGIAFEARVSRRAVDCHKRVEVARHGQPL